ncbi:hypothetical protein [Duganella sp. CF458]|uniref:hypothetical protein n=1 Tax=Duganella sp. CF458 TaxID=1884368 RepID=UPI000B843201|nr:hypothetical protein [Duganella sp. CF458]
MKIQGVIVERRGRRKSAYAQARNKGNSAYDLNGSGKGRGGLRIIYEETKDEVRVLDILDIIKET